MDNALINYSSESTTRSSEL